GEITALVSSSPHIPPRPIPVQFKIDADTIHEAFDKFDDCAKVAMNSYIKELKEAEMKEKSKIVLPGQGNIADINPSIFKKKP
ncbi:hypothetical protein DRO66_11950, partial [Candidatus Bathyarchaeota archaeon]